MGGKKIVPLNSWDKSFFEGGVFGAGAPIKSFKRALVLDEDRGSKTSLIVNWDILKPIIELCNKQCTLKDKSHKCPSKDLRATRCKMAKRAIWGSLRIVSYLVAFNKSI